MRFSIFPAILFAAAVFATAAQAASFGNWAAVVVAGDWHAHDGSQSMVFDDARHDLVADLEKIGFKPQNIGQFSAQADRINDPAVKPSDPRTISNTLANLADNAADGCFVYITSHGSPEGVRVGSGIVSPTDLAIMVNDACGDRPAVVVVSACFSGVFVPAVSTADRMVVTAAKPDRASFGCGAKDKYTYFDNCVLSAFPGSHDFPGLAEAAKACVTKEEQDTGMKPPSDPQISIGANMPPELPHW